ncbi:MAG: hypothetical protein B7Z40_21290 [Bosea sp. 12-68-7]|nr:MAG: hypothetical protein B7Z40_21290 [Bosea sp. 12-68-7]
MDADDLPWSTFTGRMREMERAVRAMADVNGTQFKLFTAVTQGMNEETGEFFCRDEVMCVTCGVNRRQSLSEARAALAKKRLIEFDPGRPGKATVYRLPMSDNVLLDHLASLTDDKIEARLLAEMDRSRRNGVRKSGRRKGDAVENSRPEKRTPNVAVSGFADAKNDVGVRFGVPSASAKADTLLPQHTPQDSAHANKVSTRGESENESPPSEPVILATIGEVIDFIDAHPSKPTGRAGELSKSDLARGERVITDHIERASREAGLTVEEAAAVIGDELAKMKRAIAEFPGDEGRAGRRIRRLLRDAKAARDAA